MTKFLLNIAAHLLLTIGLQTAQAADLTEHPGYLDIDQLAFIDGRQPSVEVTLSGPVLKMLLELPIEYDDQGQVQEMLKVVDHILVRVYSMSADQANATLGYITETSDALVQQNWQRIVRVREDAEESVDIHVKLSDDGENLTGLVIMAIDAGNRLDIDGDDDDNGDNEAEVVFVNIAGNFNPAYLANIGKQFDIEQLDGVEVP